jgi:hypothetical protein
VGRVRGISLIFPTNERTFGGPYLRGEKSLYELSANDILAPGEQNEMNKPVLIIDLVLVWEGLFDLYLRQEINSIFEGWDSDLIADITERVDLLSTAEGQIDGSPLKHLYDHFELLGRHYGQRPTVIAPFTGKGLGEPFARRWNRGGTFVLQGHKSADDDKLYVLQWDDR